MRAIKAFNLLRNAAMAAAAVILTACTTATFVSTNLNEASRLQPKIAEQFAHTDVSLTVKNNDTLEIVFVNSTFNSLYQRDQERQAQEIAAFASNNLSPSSKIGTITVKFANEKESEVARTADSVTYTFVRALLPTATP